MSEAKKSVKRLRLIFQEAHDIASSLQQSAPIDVRSEAADLVAGIRSLDDILQDMTTELAMLEADN